MEQTTSFQILSINDFQKEQSKMEWLVKDFIPKAGVGFIAGESGHGKTSFALYLAMCLASPTTTSVLGKHCTTCPVFYINTEGTHGFSDRVKRHYENFPDVENITFINHYFNFSNPDSISEIDQHIPDNGLLIVDTFASSNLGLDENSSKDCGIVLATAQMIANKHNTTVLFIHHYGKMSYKGLRGSSALRASADFIILSEKENETDETSKITLYKSRDSENGYSSTFNIVKGLSSLELSDREMERQRKIYEETIAKKIDSDDWYGTILNRRAKKKKKIA